MVFKESHELALTVHGGPPDEKSTEDIHQFIRDGQRAKRHKIIAAKSAYDMQLRRCVLEDRNIPCISVFDEAVAAPGFK